MPNTKTVEYDTQSTARLCAVRDGIITDPDEINEILSRGHVLANNAREYIAYLTAGVEKFVQLQSDAAEAAMFGASDREPPEAI